AGARARVRVELALLLDNRGEERGVQPIVAGVPTDDRRVLERIPEPRPPGRLRPLEIRERAERRRQHRRGEKDPPQEDDESSSTTPATKASSASSDPSFTYAKSAWRSFSSSGMSRDSRGSR